MSSGDLSLASVLACLPDAAALADAAGHLLSFNERFCTVTRSAAAELYGRPVQSFLHGPARSPTIANVLRRMEEAGEVWHGQVVVGRRGARGRRCKLHVGRIDRGGHPNLLLVLRDLSPEEHLHRRIQRAARTDALTGLLNRGAFTQGMELAALRSQRESHRLALLFIDLDGFKLINDGHGHEAGDAVLTEVARRFERTVRRDDLVARWGGDEFACLIRETGAQQAAVEVAERLLEEAARAMPPPLEAGIGASIGIARLPDDAASPAALLSAADQALYAAKAAGGRCWRSFAPEIAARSRERNRLRADLRRATHADELRLHYQPIVDARTLEPRGIEGLVRWQHPERGLLTPAAFLALLTQAPDTSLRLLDIQITRAIGEIPAVSAVAPELALNLDAKLIGRGEVRALLSPLHEALRARHRKLAVELTEASFGEHPAKLQHFIHAVRGDGMRLAIDDFGGGRASLLRLREISFDILKVDRAFIRSIASSARDRTISGLAAQVAAELSGVSVAEGIETAAQAAWARQLGYFALQGFRIARPMPADELARWYEAWTGGERVRLLTEMDAHDTDRLGPSCPPGLSHN